MAIVRNQFQFSPDPVLQLSFRTGEFSLSSQSLLVRLNLYILAPGFFHQFAQSEFEHKSEYRVIRIKFSPTERCFSMTAGEKSGKSASATDHSGGDNSAEM